MTNENRQKANVALQRAKMLNPPPPPKFRVQRTIFRPNPTLDGPHGEPIFLRTLERDGDGRSVEVLDADHNDDSNRGQ